MAVVLLMLTSLVCYVIKLTSAADLNCCAAGLMDTDRRVVIDNGRQAGAGVYRGLRVRACSTDPVYVQLWSNAGGSDYILKWQTLITSSSYSLGMPIIMSFGPSPLEIGPSDRIGLYTPFNVSLQLAVPYDVDIAYGNVYYSQSRFIAGALGAGVRVTLDNFRFPRSFGSNIVFCTASDCSDVAMVNPLPEDMTQPGPIGPPGASCCSNVPAPQMSCDAPKNRELNRVLDIQTSKVTGLVESVIQLQTIMTDVTSSNAVTGGCPSNTPEMADLGSCYIVYRMRVPMVLAAMSCRDNNAKLLSVDSDLEWRFVTNLIANYSLQDAMEPFWTAGMYNPDRQAWFWYDESSRTKAPMRYMVWANGQPAPVPLVPTQICLSANSHRSSSDYWTHENCTTARYFVCELPKVCV